MADYQADSPNNLPPDNMPANNPPIANTPSTNTPSSNSPSENTQLGNTLTGNAPTPTLTSSIANTNKAAGRQSVPKFQDRLSEEYTIDTPENVTFGYEVAGIGSRFVAAFIDNIFLALILFGLNIAVVVLVNALIPRGLNDPLDAVNSNDAWAGYMVIAIYALLNFLVFWGYYLLFEWLWHGQSPGKRITKLRVVRADGSPVSFVPVAVRNLVRIVDMLPAAYGVGVITMFCNRESRRLGDFAAGTLVIKDQGEITLDTLMADVSKSAPSPLRTEVTPSDTTTSDLPPGEDWSSVRRLSNDDYELVQETIARYRNAKLDPKLLSRVAIAIATKMEYIPSSSIEEIKRINTEGQLWFLKNVAKAYGRWVR